MIDRRPWKHFFGFFKGNYAELVLTLCLSTIPPLLLLPVAYLLRNCFDRIIPSRDIRLLFISGGAIILLTVSHGVLNLWTRHRLLRVIKIAVEKYRHELLKRISGLSHSFYTHADRKKLHGNIVHDSERVDYMSNVLFSQLIPSALVSLALIGVLIHLNWLLFLLLFILAPVVFSTSKMMGKMVQHRVRAFHQSFTNFSSNVMFALQMIDLTRIRSAEGFQLARQKKYLEDLRHTGHSMAWIYAAYHVVQNTITTSSSFLILIAGGFAIMNGSITLGGLISFFVIVNLLKSQFNQISYAIPNVIAGNESLAALYCVVSSNDPHPYSGEKRIAFQGDIRLDSVRFQYDEKPLLRNIHLEIKPGSMVALIGPTGSGKSTIINLILGFYRPQSGIVYADDIPYDELDLVHLRRQFGVVMQETMIFPGTIWENITYGYSDVEPERVTQAMKIAAAEEMVEQLPQGYQSHVGERGALLSGGQCQQIALARAILFQPRLLILDEPSTHLDHESVWLLMRNLSSMNPAPGILIITHDLAVASRAQQSYVLENGSLIAISGDQLGSGFNPSWL